MSRHIWGTGVAFGHQCLEWLLLMDTSSSLVLMRHEASIPAPEKVLILFFSPWVSVHAIPAAVPLCPDPRVCPSPESPFRDQVLTTTSLGSDGPRPAKAKC